MVKVVITCMLRMRVQAASAANMPSYEVRPPAPPAWTASNLSESTFWNMSSVRDAAVAALGSVFAAVAVRRRRQATHRNILKTRFTITLCGTGLARTPHSTDTCTVTPMTTQPGLACGRYRIH
jgi:hypothetical protein